MKLDPYLTLYTNFNSKWIKDLNMRSETAVSRDKTRENLLDIVLGNDFLDMIPKAQATKAKSRQMGLYQTKMFLYSK